MEYRNNPSRHWKHIASIPFIYAPFFIMVPMDLIMELYHRVAFPLYGLPLIDRSKYIKIDRQKLSYLTGLEKLNCMYCGYANGLFPYGAAICAATEAYWCGIQHEKDPTFMQPKHHENFVPFGDEKTFHEKFGE
ncbi:MAG: hypothetical protein ACK4NC_05300 [Candidatus Gracilibacteria bacterium]